MGRLASWVSPGALSPGFLSVTRTPGGVHYSQVVKKDHVKYVAKSGLARRSAHQNKIARKITISQQLQNYKK